MFFLKLIQFRLCNISQLTFKAILSQIAIHHTILYPQEFLLITYSFGWLGLSPESGHQSYLA